MKRTAMDYPLPSRGRNRSRPPPSVNREALLVLSAAVTVGALAALFQGQAQGAWIAAPAMIVFACIVRHKRLRALRLAPSLSWFQKVQAALRRLRPVTTSTGIADHVHRRRLAMQSVTRTDRTVLAFSLLAAAYFGFLALDSFVFKLDSILLGVARELLTIPLIVAVAAVFVFSVSRLLTNRRSVNPCNVGSALILFALNGLIWGV